MVSTRENVLNRTLFSQTKEQKNSASCGRKSFPQLAHFSQYQNLQDLAFFEKKANPKN